MRSNIEEHIRQCMPEGRVFLFSRPINTIKVLLGMFLTLRPSIYHSGMTDDERHQNISRWKNGETKLMIETSGFGASVDYPSVRYVHHWEGPHAMIDYGQECDRAGRNESLAHCMTWTSNCFLKPSPHVDTNVTNFLVSGSRSCIRQSSTLTILY